MNHNHARSLGALFAAALCPLMAVPVLAQETAPEAVSESAPDETPDETQRIDMDDTAFDGDYLSVGMGVIYSPSYTGSNDYLLTVIPAGQASVGGFTISPRAGGATFDFARSKLAGVRFELGLAGRLRSDRAARIQDEVVEQYGELERAIEVGPSFGFGIPRVFTRYDRLSAGVDVLWDITGAHSGTIVGPSVGYFTPLSRGMAANLSVSAKWTDADYNDYYFTVDPLAYTGAGASPLPAYDARQSGFTGAAVHLLLGLDFDGDITNGGLGMVALTGYSRVQGEAADTPFTSMRGTRDQFTTAIGVGYTF